MRYHILLFFFLLSIIPLRTFGDAQVHFPDFLIAEVPSTISIEVDDKDLSSIQIQFNGKVEAIELLNGQGEISLQLDAPKTVQIKIAEQTFEKDFHPIPLWWSIIPPLIAILIALLFKEVLSALLIGIFSGALVIHLYQGGIGGILTAFMSLIDHYILDALADADHLSIIVFSMLIGGMVSIVSRNGGMQGIVDRISKVATNAKSGQLATWLLGVAIFFDDYANTLVVGNTMRPVTDRLKISREKLAYLVDSTAAPIAAIGFVTTWIGAEIDYINSGIENIDGLDEGAYSIFLSSLQYSFYPMLTLIFMLLLIWKGKDFGPMFKAEKRARIEGLVSNQKEEERLESSDDFQKKSNIPARPINAIVPVMVVIFGTLIGLIYTGFDSEVWQDANLGFGRKVSAIIGAANSYLALLWSSLAAVIIAILLSISQRLMSLEESVSALTKGFKTMLSAVLILVLAWALASVTEELHTADFITQILSDSISPILVPALTFILAAVIAFSTGSSWSTMAILYPLMLPASWQICMSSGYEYAEALNIFNNVIACVLAGAVLGDHCSPISDTTILSSLASSCHHIDHVRTQMPYALTVGSVAILGGTIPAALGSPFWINLPVSILILFGIVHWLGKPSNSAS